MTNLKIDKLNGGVKTPPYESIMNYEGIIDCHGLNDKASQ